MNKVIKTRFLFTITSIYQETFCNYSKKSNLKKLLVSMPKEPKHIAEAQKQRQKIKERSQKYDSGKVFLHVLGSGAEGAPKALYVFTDHARYLFNCGEGTQRLAHEHKMKLSRLEHIFITHASWSNLGGLPGVALTIQDVGVSDICLHGPQGLDELFAATRRFVVLRDLSVQMANCTPETVYEDNVLTVHYVPITKVSSVMTCQSTSRGQSPVLDAVDDTDYYAHERKGRRRRRRSRSRSVNREVSGTRKPIPTPRISMEAREQTTVMNYICKLRPKQGKLELDRCVDHRVPPGPLLGLLKAGHDVTLDDGTVVESKDVCSPDEPGPVFIVADCPNEDFLDSFVSQSSWENYQSTAKEEHNMAYAVIHFSPPNIINNPRYQEWINKFPISTLHVSLNENGHCMGSAAVHRVQKQLHLLDEIIFPVLADQKVIDTANKVKRLKIEKGKTVEIDEGESGSDSLIKTANTLWTLGLRPRFGLDRSSELGSTLNEKNEDTDILEVLSLEGVPEALESVRQEIQTMRRSKACISNDSIPHFVFLGTGSCIPNKTRNTSGILIETRKSEYFLMDCGEGTFGQIMRFFGTDKVIPVLSGLKGIYISHLHADHHIGLVGMLLGRKRVLEKAGLTCEPLLLLAPAQIMSWLLLYHRRFEHILDEFKLIPNGNLILNRHQIETNEETEMLKRLGLSEVNTTLVKHCPNAFGVAIRTLSGHKITYSGDTMPCTQLVELGADSDVLIHEATMEDELAGEAKVKLHSTMSQAISVGQDMNAKHILLTHFSQRYARLPRVTGETLEKNVGLAFDYMSVGLNDLPLLSVMYPALRLFFQEHCDELDRKAARRQRRETQSRENSLKRKNSPSENKQMSSDIKV